MYFKKVDRRLSRLCGLKLSGQTARKNALKERKVLQEIGPVAQRQSSLTIWCFAFFSLPFHPNIFSAYKVKIFLDKLFFHSDICICG